jgi:hypothetical protein
MWYKPDINCVELKGAYLMALPEKKQTKSAKSGSSSSPLRGVEEVNLFLAADQDMHCKKVHLVAKRSANGGTMQPKDMITRAGLHSLLGTRRAMIVKVFMGDKEHGFITIPAVDVDKILDKLRDLPTLEEINGMNVDEIILRVITIDLSEALDLRNVLYSRNLLSLVNSPVMESAIAIHRLAQGLFPNPSVQRKGSYKNNKWVDAAPDILAGKQQVTNKMRKLVKPALLVPVNGIRVEDGISILSLHGTDTKIFVHGLQLQHDGGVVIMRIMNNTVKRQVRVLTDQKQRDLLMQPREASVYCNYDYATDTVRCAIRSKVYDQINTIQKKNDDIYKPSLDQATLVAGLAALGEVDSSESEFNEITGGLRLKAPSLISQDSNSLRDKGKMAYLLGIQLQFGHFICAKSNFVTDLLSRFINRYPSQLPESVSVSFEPSSASTTSYSFAFAHAGQVDGEDLLLKDDLIVEITRVVQSLLPKSALCESMEIEERLCICAHEDSAIMKAQSLLFKVQSLLFKVFDIYGAASHPLPTSFENMIATLFNKVKPKDLARIILVLSYGTELKEIKRVDADTLAVKDLAKNLIVQEEGGELWAYSLTASSKDRLWTVFRDILERKYGGSLFESLLKKGEDAAKEEAEALLEKGKPAKKKKPNLLASFAGSKVFSASFNLKKQFTAARAAGSERYYTQRTSNKTSTDIGNDLGSHILTEFPYNKDPTTTTMAKEDFSF